uniref:Beta/gamma crystallin 'Greek key' domain-containing protein n=1 Tax=Eptatretus burgeri TaxID=7764 RepID=A0A8C4N311_EPTBU
KIQVVLYEEEEFCGRSQEMCVTLAIYLFVCSSWVIYEEPGFQGRQLLLEEGEFPRPSAWGGYSGRLGSIRPICCVSSTFHNHLLSSTRVVPEHYLEGCRWVAYEEANFCGEQYILERGLYRSHLDWGGSDPSIGSVRPVFLVRLPMTMKLHFI